MKLTALYGSDYWCRIHAAGCRHIQREIEGFDKYDLDASTRREAIEHVACDFIFANDHQPWTDYEEAVSFAPCVKLPREATR